MSETFSMLAKLVGECMNEAAGPEYLPDDESHRAALVMLAGHTAFGGTREVRELAKLTGFAKEEIARFRWQILHNELWAPEALDRWKKDSQGIVFGLDVSVVVGDAEIHFLPDGERAYKLTPTGEQRAIQLVRQAGGTHV